MKPRAIRPLIFVVHRNQAYRVQHASITVQDPNQWNDKELCEFTYQANDDTPSEWYAFRATVRGGFRLHDQARKLLAKLAKRMNYKETPEALCTALESLGIVQGQYDMCENEFRPLADLSPVGTARYCDDYNRSGGNCHVNAIAEEGTESAQAALLKAWTEHGTHLDKLAEWIQAGRPFILCDRAKEPDAPWRNLLGIVSTLSSV